MTTLSINPEKQEKHTKGEGRGYSRPNTAALLAVVVLAIGLFLIFGG